MPLDLDRVQSVFGEAVKSGATGRAEVLDRRCSTDAELRRRVEALLMVHDQADGLLDRSFVESCVETTFLGAEPGGDANGGEAGSPANFAIAPSPNPPGEPFPHSTTVRDQPRSIAEGPGSLIGPYRLLQL